MIEEKNLFFCLVKRGLNLKYISDQVTGKLTDLTNTLMADNSIQGSMDKVMIGVFLDYNKIKSDMVGLSDAQSQIAALSSKNEQLIRDNDQLRRDLDLRTQGIGR